MGQFKAGTSAKILAIILAVISAGLSALGVAGMVALDSGMFYQLSKEEMMEAAFQEVSRKYSVVALSGYQDDFHAQELAQSNFHYGVVKTDDIDKVDLYDASSYIGGDFVSISRKGKANGRLQIPDKEQLYFFDAEIGGQTGFMYGSNIWNSYYIMENTQPWYSTEEYPLEGYYYDRYIQALYVRSGKRLFEAHIYSAYAFGDEITDIDTQMLQEYMEQESGQYRWNNYAEAVKLEPRSGPGAVVRFEDIQIVDSASLAELGEVSEEALDRIDASHIYALKQHKPDTEHYYVVSYVGDPVSGGLPIQDGDMYVQMRSIINLAYQMRYPAIVVMVLSGFVLLASFCFLMSAAGHRKGQQGIYPCLFDRMPFDLYAAGFFFVQTMLVGGIVLCVDNLIHQARNGMSGFITVSVLAIGASILSILLAVLFCMGFAVRVKLGKWWRNTLVYRSCRFCLRVVRKCIAFCFSAAAAFLRSLTLLWKAWLTLGMLAFFEYVVIMSTSYAYDGNLLVLWFLEKIIVYPLAIVVLLQMNRLQKGAQKIAAGQLDYRITTSRMFWEMKKHGEYLNDIGTGINRAVNERLKSERFKTELITNVSHDIKTPLTSIINYIDLLQKELLKGQQGSSAVPEYLEILRRQSARLKKLIEDLMEASKASTGSLSVIMEKCDAGVMLVQTLGEFEEKLMENQIELQIKKPEEPVFIEADNRHLWRVFDNLMNNICKYAQPLTRAYINLEQDSGRAVILFRNISKYQLNISSEELMERFVRGDSSRNTEGSGLGISIAKSLTELMDGTFELTVDGDLFKVAVSFPLYGMPHSRHIQDGMYGGWPYGKGPEWNQQPAQNTSGTSQIHPQGGNAGSMQTPYPGRKASGIKGQYPDSNAGGMERQFANSNQASGIWLAVVGRIGHMLHTTSRFAYHLRQAAILASKESGKPDHMAGIQLPEEDTAIIQGAEDSPAGVPLSENNAANIQPQQNETAGIQPSGNNIFNR